MTWEEEGPWSNRCFSLMWEEEFCLLFLFFFWDGGDLEELSQRCSGCFGLFEILSWSSLFCFFSKGLAVNKYLRFLPLPLSFINIFFLVPFPPNETSPAVAIGSNQNANEKRMVANGNRTPAPRWDPSTSSAYADFLLYIDVKCIVVSQLSGTLWRDKNMLS